MWQKILNKVQGPEGKFLRNSGASDPMAGGRP
eukprot:CAMPEP_0206232312 /NCGR_PEP_ID=MMETSP0047_2-20121206/11344_1 /ASSEMBLY_ACC=CAM_ASM_000192 /TAXON_ID=195065 /ORGANISM="Chroomonas mesostigmatica_cf, Strain CCMP1168" /LENGTH=31 /DNA_ID= /DNA_START= /DNA_END= /DNA_ORIENTATION=